MGLTNGRGVRPVGGDRQGQFPGMMENRTFQVVFVRENHGVGVNPADETDQVVQYSGKTVTVAR